MSVTALGHDPRFDLRHAFWLFAGIAGVDPELGSLGSVTWGRRLVDGTAVKFLDAREMPQDWLTGWLPLHRDKPYGLPIPSVAEQKDMVWTLDLHPGGLVEWAFNLTQHIKLPDHKAFASLREKYTAAPARAPPRVQLGDTLSTDVFWTGSWSAGWARNWTKYWLPAESFGGQGRLGTSAMEDFAVAEALAALHRAGLVSGVAAALLVLRSASNFMEPPAKQSPVAYMDFFLNEACEAAYLVGLPVVKELLQRPGFAPSTRGVALKDRSVSTAEFYQVAQVQRGTHGVRYFVG